VGRHQSLGVAAATAVIGLLLVAGPVAAIASAGVAIGETNNKYHFSPLTTYVNVGGSVTWTNGSDAPHTVTSDAGSELASSTIGAGKTFSHTFAGTGTFAYHCTIHTYMTGKVVVLAAGVTPPPTDTLPVRSLGTNDPRVVLTLLTLVGLLGAVVSFRRFRQVS
jgi:plastocyanin